MLFNLIAHINCSQSELHLPLPVHCVQQNRKTTLCCEKIWREIFSLHVATTICLRQPFSHTEYADVTGAGDVICIVRADRWHWLSFIHTYIRTHTHTHTHTYIYNVLLECYVVYVRNAMMLVTSVAAFVCMNIIFRPLLLQTLSVVFAMSCFKYRPGQPLYKVRVLLDFLTCLWHMPGCTTNYGACPSCPFQSNIQEYPTIGRGVFQAAYSVTTQ